MSDITEKQTFEYFSNGVKKAKSAARELATLNERGDWIKIRSVLGQIERNAEKLYNSRSQTRLQTLALAEKIEKEEAVQSAGSPLIIH